MTCERFAPGVSREVVVVGYEADPRLSRWKRFRNCTRRFEAFLQTWGGVMSRNCSLSAVPLHASYCKFSFLCFRIETNCVIQSVTTRIVLTFNNKHNITRHVS